MERSRLAFSTGAMRGRSLASAVRSIASAGYAGAQVVFDEPHFCCGLPDEQKELAVEARRLLVELGLPVVNVDAATMRLAPGGDTYHPSWVEAEVEGRRERIEHTRRAIELAAVLGAPSVSVGGGGPTVGRDVHELRRMLADGLWQCLDAARGAGVTLLIKPTPGLVIDRPAAFEWLKMEHFDGEPALQMNADVGAMFCVREDPPASLRHHAGAIRHVELADMHYQRVYRQRVPGEGAIDFGRVLEALDESGYVGFVTVALPHERDGEGAARRALEYLSPLLS